ncbi:alpha-aminoadipic semialdehyde synthase, mitochondrial-like [Glandiceps talaboti]
MWKNRTVKLYRRVLTVTQNHAVRPFSGNPQRPLVIALRREDGTPWERRAAIGPKHVQEITNHGIKVLVQPSNKLVYSMQEYENSGAVVQEDITEASLIICLKQVPIEKLIPNKSYAFFSLTSEAWKESMPLLDAMLEKKIRLVDYEMMVDDMGKRLLAFGKFAGIAGTIDILHGLGMRLLGLGHNTPFVHIGLAHSYRDIHAAKQAVKETGHEIALGLMPKSIGPLTFVFTGSGNASQGAQEIFKELPHRFVPPAELEYAAKYGDHKTIYGTVINKKDHLFRKNGTGFCSLEYKEHPDLYESNFNTRYAPWASVIVNCIHWTSDQPKLVKKTDLATLLGAYRGTKTDETEGCPGLPHRLLAISDIAAETGGSVELVERGTTIGSPFSIHKTNDVHYHLKTDSLFGEGVLLCSIGNMPTQLPKESVDYFGSILLPYIKEMAAMNANQSLDSETHLSPVVRDAIICSNGELTPKYKYIEDLRKEHEI